MLGNAADIIQFFMKEISSQIWLLTKHLQHELIGYIPNNYTLEEADSLRSSDEDAYVKESIRSMGESNSYGYVEIAEKGAIVFDYGNNIRAQAVRAGVKNAFDFPGFVPEYIRPLFCEGKGPFRWVALSGDPEDIYKTDSKILELFPKEKSLQIGLPCT